jgi:hypothetical protein
MYRNNSIKTLQVKKHEDADNFQIDQHVVLNHCFI